MHDHVTKNTVTNYVHFKFSTVDSSNATLSVSLWVKNGQTVPKIQITHQISLYRECNFSAIIYGPEIIAPDPDQPLIGLKIGSKFQSEKNQSFCTV